MAKRKKIQSYRHGGPVSTMIFRPRRAADGGQIGGLLGTGAFAALGLPPQLGTLIGSQVGGLFDRGETPEEESARLLEEQRGQQSRFLRSQDEQRRLNAFPTFGVRGATVFANGGIVPTNRALRDDLLVAPRAGTVQDLSGNVAKFNGRTHGEGGIPLDADGDGVAEVEVEDQEVIKDDKIFSDRLRVPDFIIDRIKDTGITVKPGATFAEAAEKLGKAKGRFEEKLESRDPAIISTGKIMTQRIDDLMESIFQVQEANKPAEDNTQQLAHGGMVDSRLGKFGHLIPMGPDTVQKFKRQDGGRLPIRDSLLDDSTIRSDNTRVDTNRLPPFLPSRLPLSQSLRLNQLLPEIPLRANELGEEDVRRIQETQGGSNRLLPTSGRARLKFQGGGLLSGQGAGNLDFNLGLPPTSLTRAQVPRQRTRAGARVSMIGQGIKNFFGEDGGFQGVRDFVNENLGNIAGTTQFLANRRSIDDLVTNVKPVLAPVPQDRFVDRSGLARAETQSLVQSGLTNLGRTGLVNRGAASSLIGQGINANSRIANAENIRRDQFESRLRDQQSRINALNIGAANRGNAMNAARINDQIALRVQNRGALTQGIIGNQFARQQRDQTNKALAIRAFQSGDRGTINRMARDLGFDTTEEFLRSLLN